VPFDFIFCRNVLIYFSQHHIKRIFEMFSRLLRPGGWLVTSPVETSYGNHASLSLVDFKKAMLFRNGGGAAVKRDVSVPPAEWARLEVAKPAALSAVSPFSLPVPSIAAHAPLKAASAPRSGFAEAVRLHAAGRQTEALAALDREPEAGDRMAERAALRARIHADLGNGAEALRWCDRAIAADRVRSESYYLLASIKMEYDDEPGGAQALRQALFLNPDFLMAHYSLGTLLLRLGKPSEAQKQLSIAHRLLQPRGADEIVEGSEGLTAGHLRALIEMLLEERGEWNKQP
jgi:chemotaxis protein methyltransferase CheR